MQAGVIDKEKFEKEIEAYLELQKPTYHTPIDLGISAFKRELVNLPKKLRNKFVKAFKKRAWAEYHGVARHRGNFPTHNDSGKTIVVENTTEETKVKINGKTAK